MPEIIVKLGERVLQRYYFDKDVLTVGRARDNDIVIENLSVSRNHARLKRQDGKFVLIDMNSSNGSLVNGVRVTKAEVVHNDQITIGKHTLLFLDTENHPSAASGPPVDMGGVAPTADLPPPAQASRASGVNVKPATQPPAPAAAPQPAPAVPTGMPPRVSAPSAVSAPKLPPTAPPPPPLAGRSGGSAVIDKPAVAYRPEGQIGALVIMKGKQEDQSFRVYKAETTIGRAAHNDVRLHDWLVSNKHAVIRRDGDKYYIRDLGSWRGTELNGAPLKAELLLQHGAEIVMGTTVLQFTLADATHVPAPPPVQAPPEVPVALDALPSSVHVQLPPEFTAGAVSPGTPAVEDLDSEVIVPDDDVSLDAVDDDFSPMTEDELEALDREIDVFDIGDREEVMHRHDSWEMTEAEKMFEGAEGQETFGTTPNGDPGFSLIESHDKLRAAEEAVVNYSPHEIRPPALDELAMADEEIEEEEALYHGEMTDDPPYGEPPRAATGHTAGATALAPERQKEVELWEKALRNKSRIIRKNAAKELKKLTGRDYDWESEPSD